MVRRRLCRRSPVEWRLSRVPPFYYADIIIIMAKGAKEEQKFAAPIFELVAKWDDE